MPPSSTLTPYICARCLRPRQRAPGLGRTPNPRRFAHSAPHVQEQKSENHDGEHTHGEKEEGALSRRLREMTEESLESGGHGAQKAVDEAGFSEDLKRELQERLASANFRAENRSAFAEAELPSHAGRGTRDIATASPWSGEESIHDASLRMLNDAHKPLKTGRGPRIPTPSMGPPKSVDTGRKNTAAPGVRLADARDRSSVYAILKESDLSDKERESRFQELKDRFSPNARSVVPGTVQGLASLANKRIEDAIARGQFKNLANRGKKIERDYNASNPFLDTTEYFMNKMIQKQEIVPPWIEKQQELVSAANKFRQRLRADWRRHAARMIASKGGTLQDQIQRAEAFAKAEMAMNPPKQKQEILNMTDRSGHVSQISLSGELKLSSDTEGTAEVIKAEKLDLEELMTPGVASGSTASGASETMTVSLGTQSPSILAAPYPFRDEAWLQTENSYLTLSINELNSKTRSYNLQAPDLAKKPYFSLERELRACYADIAPQLAAAIKERALSPKAKTVGFSDSLGSGQVGVMDRLVGEKVKVREERIERRYGFRQFWKDVWGEK